MHDLLPVFSSHVKLEFHQFSEIHHRDVWVGSWPLKGSSAEKTCTVTNHTLFGPTDIFRYTHTLTMLCESKSRYTYIHTYFGFGVNEFDTFVGNGKHDGWNFVDHLCGFLQYTNSLKFYM